MNIYCTMDVLNISNNIDLTDPTDPSLNIICTKKSYIGSEIDQLRVAICGSADSGKSTLTGVMTGSELDDGRGSARRRILRHGHEKESGKTSTISYNYIKYDSKEISLFDLAGQEKYIKITTRGLVGHNIDYAIVVIGSNMGITPITREHITLLLWQKIPFVILFTKIDMCPPHLYAENLTRIKNMPKNMSRRNTLTGQFMLNKTCRVLDSDDAFGHFFANCNNPSFFDSNIPVIPISCKTGMNIDRLHVMFSVLTHRVNTLYENVDNSNIFAYIEHVYTVPGIKLVITGFLDQGCAPISVGTNMYVGMINGNLLSVRVRSLHDNFRNLVQTILPGQNFCANIHVKGKFNLQRCHFNKGSFVTTRQESALRVSKRFRARIQIILSKNTIGINYTPVIHCRTICQSARLIHIEQINDELLTGAQIDSAIPINAEAIVVFEFDRHAEYIEPGAPLFLRDGSTKGSGTMIEHLY
jgi:elongation factor 1-alpha